MILRACPADAVVAATSDENFMKFVAEECIEGRRERDGFEFRF